MRLSSMRHEAQLDIIVDIQRESENLAAFLLVHEGMLTDKATINGRLQSTSFGFGTLCESSAPVHNLHSGLEWI